MRCRLLSFSGVIAAVIFNTLLFSPEARALDHGTLVQFKLPKTKEARSLIQKIQKATGDKTIDSGSLIAGRYRKLSDGSIVVNIAGKSDVGFLPIPLEDLTQLRIKPKDLGDESYEGETPKEKELVWVYDDDKWQPAKVVGPSGNKLKVKLIEKGQILKVTRDEYYPQHFGDSTEFTNSDDESSKSSVSSAASSEEDSQREKRGKTTRAKMDLRYEGRPQQKSSKKEKPPSQPKSQRVVVAVPAESNLLDLNVVYSTSGDPQRIEEGTQLIGNLVGKNKDGHARIEFFVLKGEKPVKREFILPEEAVIADATEERLSVLTKDRDEPAAQEDRSFRRRQHYGLGADYGPQFRSPAYRNQEKSYYSRAFPPRTNWEQSSFGGEYFGPRRGRDRSGDRYGRPQPSMVSSAAAIDLWPGMSRNQWGTDIQLEPGEHKEIFNRALSNSRGAKLPTNIALHLLNSHEGEQLSLASQISYFERVVLEAAQHRDQDYALVANDILSELRIRAILGMTSGMNAKGRRRQQPSPYVAYVTERPDSGKVGRSAFYQQNHRNAESAAESQGDEEAERVSYASDGGGGDKEYAESYFPARPNGYHYGSTKTTRQAKKVTQSSSKKKEERERESDGEREKDKSSSKPKKAAKDRQEASRTRKARQSIESTSASSAESSDEDEESLKQRKKKEREKRKEAAATAKAKRESGTKKDKRDSSGNGSDYSQIRSLSGSSSHSSHSSNDSSSDSSLSDVDIDGLPDTLKKHAK